MLIVLAILILIILMILASCVKIVPQTTALVIERLGAYNGTWKVGIHFKVPIIDRVARESDLKRAGCGFCPTAGDHKR